MEQTPQWTDSFEVTLVRHGETDFNLRTVMKLEDDSPLNSTGIQQAKLIAERLKSVVFDQVFTSNLKRAVETTQAIVHHPETRTGQKIIVDSRLRERDFCELAQEGTLVTDMTNAAIKYCTEVKKPIIYYNIPDGGETYEECLRRVLEFFELLITFQELYTNISQSNSKRILIVSHSLWIMTLVDHLLTNTNLYEVDITGSVENVNKILLLLKSKPRNTAVTKLRFDRQVGTNEKRRFQLTVYNDAAHLT